MRLLISGSSSSSSPSGRSAMDGVLDLRFSLCFDTLLDDVLLLLLSDALVLSLLLSLLVVAMTEPLMFESELVSCLKVALEFELTATELCFASGVSVGLELKTDSLKLCRALALTTVGVLLSS